MNVDRWIAPPQTINEFDSLELLLVVRDSYTLNRVGDGRNDGVEAATTVAFGLSIRHQPRANQTRFLVKGEDAPARVSWRRLPSILLPPAA